MPAEHVDLTIEEGADFDVDVVWRDTDGSVIDLSTGYTALMHIRATKDASTTLAASDSEPVTIALTLSSGGVNIAMTAAHTAALDFERAVYDLEIIETGVATTRIMEGDVILSREVSRAA